MNQWQIKEESRRKNVNMVSSGSDYFLFTTGTVKESGKRHRLVISYIDENGIGHSPVFGISSMGGQAIKEWAPALYKTIANNTNINKEYGEIQQKILENTTKKNNSYDVLPDPMTILKLRFAKGEINKQEFEETKKLLE